MEWIGCLVAQIYSYIKKKKLGYELRQTFISECRVPRMALGSSIFDFPHSFATQYIRNHIYPFFAHPTPKCVNKSICTWFPAVTEPFQLRFNSDSYEVTNDGGTENRDVEGFGANPGFRLSYVLSSNNCA